MEFREGALEDLAIDPKFWRKRKVLLTGHTGFKGSWLSLWLQALGAELTGLSLSPPTKPSLFELARVAKGMRSLKGDVRDFRLVKKTIAGTRAEIVIHMAAQSLVRPSYSDPLGTYSTNVMGTANVLESVRQTGTARVVLIVTSDKCYQNRERRRGYRENDPLGGYDPYSSSKACAELVTSAYGNSFFTRSKAGSPGPFVASARAGNVIGGGDWAKDRLVPDIIRSFLARKSAPIRSPKAIRPWQHVLDPLYGYLLLVRNLWEDGRKFAGPWNFGPAESESKPVEWIAGRLAQLWGEGAAWRSDRSPKPHEAGTLRLDCSNARHLLGWRPRLDLNAAIDWTAAWYRQYANKGDSLEFTTAQIAEFSVKRPL